MPPRGLWICAFAAAGCVTTEVDDVGTAISEVRVCADGPTVEGIDVSVYQGAIDWDAVANAGIGFAFIRTSHGLGTLDSRYADNWGEAHRVGIPRGTYQYFSPGQDPVAQADLLIDRMGDFVDGDLPPVLDVEQADGQSPAQIVAAIRAWSDRIQDVLGVLPIIYTAKYFWQDSVGAPADFLDHPLWIANYTTDCPLIADPWTRWAFWQYSSTGTVDGIATAVDRDVWNGSADELAGFAWPPPDDQPPLHPGGVRGDPDGGDGDPTGGCTASGGPAGLLAVGAALAGCARRRRRP